MTLLRKSGCVGASRMVRSKSPLAMLDAGER